MIEAVRHPVCFAERESVLKNPAVFTDLGFRNIIGFAQVSFYYDIKSEPWDTWLTNDNEYRDLPWLQQQPPGRRGLHLGGWFAHDTFPEWHGREAAKRLAAEIARRFPGEAQPIDLLYIDHEGNRPSEHLTTSLADLAPLCKKVANFNFFRGPGWWGENPPEKDSIGVGCPEWYGGAKNITRFKRAIRMNPGCAPVLPVCSADTDWSRIAPWDKIVDATRNLLTYWHGQHETNRVCIIAPYMLNKATGGPSSNYFASPERLGFGRSIEYMSELDLMLSELGES